jgi:hypothetical protein
MSTNSIESNPRAVLQELVSVTFAKAKRWSGAALALQMAVFIGGIVAVFTPPVSTRYPWVALPIALIGVWIGATGARYKGIAEGLKREHEYLDGFGKKPSTRRLANLRIEISDELKLHLATLLREGISYASESTTGPTRMLENLCESAWFSQHLAAFCAVCLRACFVVTISIAATLLLLCATTLTGMPVGVAAAKCVSATILFIISIGTLRGWLSFHSFSVKSEQIDAEASSLLAAGTPDCFEVQRLLAEYQVSRTSTPLIPTWVWRVRRHHLNTNWGLRAAASKIK